jgi:hypothetical protein
MKSLPFVFRIINYFTLIIQKLQEFFDFKPRPTSPKFGGVLCLPPQNLGLFVLPKPKIFWSGLVRQGGKARGQLSNPPVRRANKLFCS